MSSHQKKQRLLWSSYKCECLNFFPDNNHDTEKENRNNGVDSNFKVPDVPQKRKRGRPRKNNSDGFGSFFDASDDADSNEKPIQKKFSGRGRKKIVPMSLKMCSECGEQFQDHASNLTHWKDKHPGKDISKRIFKTGVSLIVNKHFIDVPTVTRFSVTA